LKNNSTDAKYVASEIQILSQLSHKNLANFLGAGSNGYVQKPSGGRIAGINYILTEQVKGNGLFEICQQHKALGEEGARYFMK